ncbi:TetR/AcrR family transcriptional regulator [Aeromonas salmonicida]
MSTTPVSDRNNKELAILKAATSVFLAYGFSAATTDMIQRESGVSKATMYAYFPNKEVLFAAVIEHECGVMAATFRAMDSSPGNIAKTLSDLGMSYLDIVLSPTALALHRVVMAEAPRFPELGRRFFLAGPKVVTSILVERLDVAVQAREIDVHALTIEAAATQFLSMLRAQPQMECLTHPGTHPSTAQKVHWVQLAVTTFLRAFGVARTTVVF